MLATRSTQRKQGKCYYYKNPNRMAYMVFDYDTLKAFAPYGKDDILNGIVKYQIIIQDYGIYNHRLQMFMAQIAHESDGFRTTTEYSSGESYEGRKDLGNLNPGDGPRFKGRGLIQLTGRHNYEVFSKILGKPLINYPESVANFPLALEVSCLYWRQKDLNRYADKGDFETITKRINGGLIGYDQRLDYLNKAVDYF